MNESAAIKVVAGALIDIAMEHKIKTFIVVLFHIFAYGLAMKQISEFKSWLDFFSFLR